MGIVYNRHIIESIHLIERRTAFEDTVISIAKQHNMQGVVCGHIHYAQIRDVDGVIYYNDGDWVESCTALVEDHDGEFHLLDWFSDEELPDDRLPESRKQSLQLNSSKITSETCK